MISKYKYQLQQVEKLSEISFVKKQDKFPYKQYRGAWVKADSSIAKLYKKSLKYSEIQFYPNKSYKSWGVWFLTKLGFKKGTIELSSLLGILVNWPFLKINKLPLQADVIYYRKHTAVLIYATLEIKKVIKVALSKHGQELIKSQIEGQKTAGKLNSEEVCVPKIMKKHVSNDLVFIVEELYIGKKQTFNDREKLQLNYGRAFKFLIDVYLSHPIELQYPSENKYLNHDFVETYIKTSLVEGDLLMAIYKDLNDKQKQLILCQIHGDLNHTNLLSNNNNLCIIDWAGFKHYYLVGDLENSNYNTEPIFNEFVERAGLNRDGIHIYNEQLFFKDFIEMSSVIYTALNKGTISNKANSRIKLYHKRLIKISHHLKSK